MEISTPIGLVVTFAALILAFMLDEGQIGGLLRPTAAIIVIGGTVGAAITSFPLSAMLKSPKLLILSVKPPKLDFEGTIALFVQLADKARREGLLSLEEDAEDHRPLPPSRRHAGGRWRRCPGGARILESEIANMEERHKSGYGMLAAMGGFSPTMGIIGTVIGLTRARFMAENPDGIGEKIALGLYRHALWRGFRQRRLAAHGNKLKGFSANARYACAR